MDSDSSLSGSFLIASPALADPNFARSVVFMVEHNAEGAFGLVITRPTRITLGDLCDQIFDDAPPAASRELLESYPVFTGGPVQKEAVFFLHTLESLGEANGKPRAGPGIYLGNESDELRALLERLGDDEPPSMRLFFGYAGWGEGQLEREIAGGSWLVRPATFEGVFSRRAGELWNELLRSFGGALGLLGRMPPDPELN